MTKYTYICENCDYVVATTSNCVDLDCPRCKERFVMKCTKIEDFNEFEELRLDRDKIEDIGKDNKQPLFENFYKNFTKPTKKFGQESMRLDGLLPITEKDIEHFKMDLKIITINSMLKEWGEKKK